MRRVVSCAALLCVLLMPALAEDDTASECIINLDCVACLPDNMPVVTSPANAGGILRLPRGQHVQLWCAGGAFLAYPLQRTLTVNCEKGRFRVNHDGALRHLLDLGCQENVFEDVLHEVEDCPTPKQGRAYQLQQAGGPWHLAVLCYDTERALATHLYKAAVPRDALPLPSHAHRTQPLSLLGNFGHMFDAATRHQALALYSDEDRLNTVLRELLKHDAVSLAAQTLTAVKFLPPQYFEPQNVRVTDFTSNQFLCWRSVAQGNLRHAQHDVARLLARTRHRGSLYVHAGPSGVVALRTGHNRTELYLKPEKRFPVPNYIWTVVHDVQNRTAIAIVILNDPYVTVSEIRQATVCESVCGSIPWLHDLRRNHNYETPVYGLAFCCHVHDFSNLITELPKTVLKNVHNGTAGLLTEFFV